MKKNSKAKASDFLKKKKAKKELESFNLKVVSYLFIFILSISYLSMLYFQIKQFDYNINTLNNLNEILNQEKQANDKLIIDVNKILEEQKKLEESKTINEEDLKYEDLIKEFGEMGDAMVIASKEYDVPLGLIIGIANAESTFGKNFYNPHDIVCKNWWGIKGGNTNLRIENENSYIRCFNDELAGARTVAKTLRLYYLDEGRDTPEKIAEKWVGRNQTKWHSTWVNNVNKYYNK